MLHTYSHTKWFKCQSWNAISCLSAWSSFIMRSWWLLIQWYCCSETNWNLQQWLRTSVFLSAMIKCFHHYHGELLIDKVKGWKVTMRYTSFVLEELKVQSIWTAGLDFNAFYRSNHLANSLKYKRTFEEERDFPTQTLNRLIYQVEKRINLDTPKHLWSCAWVKSKSYCAIYIPVAIKLHKLEFHHHHVLRYSKRNTWNCCGDNKFRILLVCKNLRIPQLLKFRTCSNGTKKS